MEPLQSLREGLLFKCTFQSKTLYMGHVRVLGMNTAALKICRSGEERHYVGQSNECPCQTSFLQHWKNGEITGTEDWVPIISPWGLSLIKKKKKYQLSLQAEEKPEAQRQKKKQPRKESKSRSHWSHVRDFDRLVWIKCIATEEFSAEV